MLAATAPGVAKLVAKRSPSVEERGFEGVGGVALEQGRDVSVGVHGDADLGVAEHLHDNAGVDAEAVRMVAQECRRSCRRRCGRSASRRRRSHSRVTLRGSSAVPVVDVNTRSSPGHVQSYQAKETTRPAQASAHMR